MTKEQLKQARFCEKSGYLERYKRLDKAINKNLEERDRWKAKAEKTTTTISDMPSGNNGENPTELAIIEMIEHDTKANKLIDQLFDLRDEIRQYMLASGDNDKDLLEAIEIEKY